MSDRAALKPRMSHNQENQKPNRLLTPGFLSLLGISFFGAANDNILKQILTLMVVVGGIWENRLGEGTVGVVSLVLTVPFIFLSGYAGEIADKFSKRRVILWVKIAEVPICFVGFIGLALGHFWIAIFTLLLLAIQSSFFGPAKFGVIPDLVDSHRLSQANGLVNATSNVAVICGSLIAGQFADIYHPTQSIPRDEVVAFVQAQGADDLGGSVTIAAAQEWLESGDDEFLVIADPAKTPQRLPVGLAMVGVSLLGLIAALVMPKMKPVDPSLRLTGSFFRPHLETIRDSNRPLLVVLFSWTGFYLIASLALMMFNEYRSILGVSNVAITNLIGLLAISIMIGSLTVGFLSGKTIRPYFALLGAMGLTIVFAIMGLAEMTYQRLAILTFLVGFSAGFYIVPLQSLLQFLSPSNERGRFFGTANALSFVFISAAGLIYIALARLGLPPERVPLVCAGLALIGTIVGGVELRRIMAAQKSVRIYLDTKSS